MIMENRALIMELVEAFDKSESEKILSYLSDDFQWHMLGDFFISGKENMSKFLQDHADMGILSCSKDRILVDGDRVAVEGEVQCSGKDEVIYDMYYCDIYELERGKVNKMISYTVNKKKSNQI
jgi:ketosteroid isomerase-like protein